MHVFFCVCVCVCVCPFVFSMCVCFLVCACVCMFVFVFAHVCALMLVQCPSCQGRDLNWCEPIGRGGVAHKHTTTDDFCCLAVEESSCLPFDTSKPTLTERPESWGNAIKIEQLGQKEYLGHYLGYFGTA